MTRDEIMALVRTVPDFPAPGILFRDLTTLITHPAGFSSCIGQMAHCVPGGIGAIAGVEARGFIFGAALAVHLGLGFIPVRKAGKLPVPTIGTDYALEYGAARIEIDPTLLALGQSVLLVDDLIATGGTALAAAHLLREAGAVCDTALFVIDLPDLGGMAKLAEQGVEGKALLKFAGH
ncbi:adenine phosphoribosyltransferase [Alteraurantiacibacter palmitatis]|uniref:Adenine phosphoribosyltransferase n=1 Tax=Alteraurantiacibacter palmitatis TaxID=2054628 RepID=A0ABV7E1Q5_9SPHN